MNLEKRVELLEQEVQILKNQIQASLLDIREEILTHKHPSLRSEDMSPPDDNAPVSIIKSVGAEDTHQADAYPTNNDIVLEERTPAEPITSPDQSMPGYAVNPRASTELGWEAFAKLEDWATSKFEQMNPGQVRDLIELYTQQGHFTHVERDALMQLVSLIDAWNDDQTLVESARQIEQKRKSEPVHSNGKSAKRDEFEDKDSAPRNLVLKLIAGIQNTGVDRNWRGNNG